MDQLVCTQMDHAMTGNAQLSGSGIHEGSMQIDVAWGYLKQVLRSARILKYL